MSVLPRSARVAVAACAALVALLPSIRAEAADPGSGSPVAFGLGLGGMVPPAGMLGLAVLTSSAVWPERKYGYMIALYVTGGLGVGLGTTAIVVQATQSGTCDSDCKAAYGLGAGAMGLGLLAVGIGIALSVDLSHRPRHAWLAPTPIALRTPRGMVPGVGLAGVVF